MQSPEHQREEALRARRQTKRPGPQAQRPHRLGRASALGNAAVQRLLRSVGVQRSGAGPNTLDESVARAIHSKRGTGQGLDSAVRRDVETAMNQDFSDVRVHTDTEADQLNSAVRAEAFTIGQDIFFRQGKYDAGSSEGRKLLTHELTHVVQQRSATPAQELTVSSPEDASERQASAVAERLSGPARAATVARQPAEEEEELQASALVERQAEEEEELQASATVERQPTEEEVELQASAAVERQPVEEEEEVAAS